MNKETCRYYEVSRKYDSFKEIEAFNRYDDIGCYECDGLNDKCPIYINSNTEYERQKKKINR